MRDFFNFDFPDSFRDQRPGIEILVLAIPTAMVAAVGNAACRGVIGIAVDDTIRPEATL